MMQRLQVLCPAHRSRSALPIHKFRWTPPALSQMTFCQPRSLRLPRRLSFAAFVERCIFANASPPPQLPVSTPPLDAATQTLPHTAACLCLSVCLSVYLSVRLCLCLCLCLCVRVCPCVSVCVCVCLRACEARRGGRARACSK